MMTHEEWLNKNPLKKWLIKNRRTQAFIASYLQVAVYTVYLYLRGTYTPRNHWDKLIDITDNENFVVEWEDWLKLREDGEVDYST